MALLLLDLAADMWHRSGEYVALSAHKYEQKQAHAAFDCCEWPCGCNCQAQRQPSELGGFLQMGWGRAVSRSMQDDMHFRVLRVLERRPEISQRELAQELGIALGKANYVLNALTEKGLLKVNNFRGAQNKLRYAYMLTPAGLAAKAELTSGFLRRKMAEYELLKAEIESLHREAALGADMAPAPRSSCG